MQKEFGSSSSPLYIRFAAPVLGALGPHRNCVFQAKRHALWPGSDSNSFELVFSEPGGDLELTQWTTAVRRCLENDGTAHVLRCHTRRHSVLLPAAGANVLRHVTTVTGPGRWQTYASIHQYDFQWPRKLCQLNPFIDNHSSILSIPSLCRRQLQNPVNNIADADNVWSFDTLRPDGVAREASSGMSGFEWICCYETLSPWHLWTCPWSAKLPRTLHALRDSFSILTSNLTWKKQIN